MAAAKLTPQQQRDRRAKILLGVLGVVLLGVLVLQLPKLLKSGHPAAAAPPPAATTTSASLASAPAAAPASGQLERFSEFAPKDPFHSQVSVTTPGQSPGASTTAAAPQPQPKPKPKPATKPPAPITFSVKQQPSASAPSGPLVPAALLTFDGKKHVIALGDAFPAKKPLFRLVALSPKAIWLQLIGGSLADGKTTLKVLRGHPVTLVNTTARTRFVLALVKPTTTKQAQPQPATATAPTTTTSG